MTQSVLLMLGDYYGSLAAARLLGRKGCQITFADPRMLVPAKWSRYVQTRITAPSSSDLTAYTAWLLDFGKQNPGTFLYAVSDDLCWIIAKNRRELAKNFILYQPDLANIYHVLNKQQLYQTAETLGMQFPRTIFPDSWNAVEEYAKKVVGPVLIKPKTQIGFYSKTKGKICTDGKSLLAAYQEFRAINSYHREVNEYDQTVTWPMIQEYHPTATNATLSIGGFVTQDGKYAVRAAQKVFQRPRRLGVGVGFEARPMEAKVMDAVLQLCKKVGYYGIFEVEFINNGNDQYLLTDFNPRYYGQMQFEIDRLMPLPWMALLAAKGQDGELSQVIQEANSTMASPIATQSRYAHSWILRLLVFTQSLSRRMSGKDREYWLNWLNSPLPRFESVKDKLDMRPYWFDLLANGRQFMRHPRDFFRKFFLDE